MIVEVRKYVPSGTDLVRRLTFIPHAGCGRDGYQGVDATIIGANIANADLGNKVPLDVDGMSSLAKT